MSTEVVVPDGDDVEVAVASPLDEVTVAVEADDVVEIVVGPGEGDAVVVVESTPDVEIEVDASAVSEVEVVEQDTLPAVDHVIEIIAGPRGPQGDPGVGLPPGGVTSQVLVKASAADYVVAWADPAEGSVDLDHYTHVQAVPAAVWTIDHPLTFRPAVSVVDSAGSIVEGDVDYLSEDRIQITFSSGFSGAAYLS